MLKEVILQHKVERDNLLLRNYIPREKLGFARKFLDQNLIKVVTGPRRVGKSVFSLGLLRNKKFAYLNFDDENLLKTKNYDEIVKIIFEIYPQAEFILFDEIQNLDKWEIFVNKLQRRGFNLILTGSNAKLLSKELATTLTGRYVPLEIFPFTFKEFLKAKNFKVNEEKINLPKMKGMILNYLDEYLKNGGFPEVVVKDLDPKTYLETLFDAILLRDVVKRYKVRFSQKIYDLATYLSFRSTNTVEKYLNYLEEAYLVFSLNRFSFKVKEQIKAPRKIYLVDNGLVLAKSFQFSKDIGRLLENLVFVEILRRGYKPNRDVFCYKNTNGSEVDFVLRKGIKIEKLIQVCYEMDNLKIKEREFKGLVKAGKELNCEDLRVITWDYEGKEEFKGREINLIPLWRWLLGGDGGRS